MKYAFIGTYPPRECGIGTFTHNLLDSVLHAKKAEKGNFEAFVVAVNDHDLSYNYPQEVKLHIRQEHQRDYLRAAKYINLSGADICILQHEFGIYGGQNGIYILPLLHRLEIPIVVTLHTILKTPSYNEKAVLQEIGKMAHDNGCVFVADTISTYGLLPINIEEENIDFCMSSAQKGLCAMTGVSWAVGKIDEIEKSKNYPKRSYYCNLFMQYDFFDRVGEMHFTPPVQVIYALQQAIKEYKQEGEQARYDRLTQCWEAIHRGLEEIALGYVIDKAIQGRLVVTVKAPEDDRFDFAKLHDYCYERGFTIYPGKMFGLATFRLCNLGWITSKDIEDFFVVAKEAFKEMGYTIPIK